MHSITCYSSIIRQVNKKENRFYHTMTLCNKKKPGIYPGICKSWIKELDENKEKKI
jgi:hypothetical protein